MTEHWGSVDDVRAHLDVAKGSVYSWVDAKSLPAHKIGKLWTFKFSGVDSWVRGGGALHQEEPTNGTVTPSKKPTGGR